jgi:hypothetical protein
MLLKRHDSLFELWMTDYHHLFGIPEGGSKFHDGVHDISIIRRYGGFYNLNDLWSERIHQLPRSVTHNRRDVEPQIARKVRHAACYCCCRCLMFFIIIFQSVESPFAREFEQYIHPPRVRQQSLLVGKERKTSFAADSRVYINCLCVASSSHVYVKKGAIWFVRCSATNARSCTSSW